MNGRDRRQDHKSEKAEYDRQYYQEHKTKKAEYYQKNKIRIAEYNKQHRKSNKELIEFNRQYQKEHPLYATWHGMKQRCFDLNHSNYKYYGECGVGVCKEWLDYKTFEKWCLDNGWQPGLTIDRIDNNGDYKPNNCQIITRSENSRKRWGN